MAEIQRHLIRRNSPPTPTLKSLHTGWFAESHLTWVKPQVIISALYRWPPSKLYLKSYSISSQSRIPDFLGLDPSRRDFFFFFTDRDRHISGRSAACLGVMHLSQSRLHHSVHIWVIPRDHYSDQSLALSCSYPTVGRVRSDVFDDISHGYDRTVAALH